MSSLYQKLISTNSFFLFAGPCVVESRELLFKVGKELKTICQELEIPFAFKASFKKANRSKLSSFTGIGDELALKYIKEVGKEFNIPTLTDVHTVADCNLAKDYVDILQIPAFLCRQTDLLVAAAKTGKIVTIKKGQFLSAQAMKFAVEKLIESGNKNHLVTERGTTFGYKDLIVDFRAIPIINSFSHAILDVTHSLQQPNQEKGITAGQPEFIETISKAGIASGVKGIFMETHPNPKEAKSDGENMLPLNKVKALLVKLKNIKNGCI